jgi:hypothetical protein
VARSSARRGLEGSTVRAGGAVDVEVYFDMGEAIAYGEGARWNVTAP